MVINPSNKVAIGRLPPPPLLCKTTWGEALTTTPVLPLALLLGAVLVVAVAVVAGELCAVRVFSWLMTFLVICATVASRKPSAQSIVGATNTLPLVSEGLNKPNVPQPCPL